MNAVAPFPVARCNRGLLAFDGDPGAGEGPRAQVRRFSLYILCIYTRELERTKLLTGGRGVVFLKR